MSPLSDRTRPMYATDPQRFRAVATGVGYSVSRSAVTGARRAQVVADSMPAHCRAAVPPAEGYPPPMQMPVSGDGGAKRY